MTPEIHARRERDAGRFERLECEALAVETERGTVSVDEEPAGRHDRNAETELAQRGHQVVPAGLEFAPARFDDRQRLRAEARERRALR